VLYPAEEEVFFHHGQNWSKRSVQLWLCVLLAGILAGALL
jgi:hypothetical protein